MGDSKETAYLKLDIVRNVVYIHVINWHKVTPSFAKEVIATVDEHKSKTLVTAMPKVFAERISHILKRFDFELKCARFENGEEIHHFVRRAKE